MDVIAAWSAAAVFFTAAAILFFKYHTQRKNRRRLSDSAERFLNGGERTQISIKDDDFSSLVNAVAELEYRLDLERDKLNKEIKKSGDFIADVSHQLKTPLAGLRLYNEMDAGLPGSHSESSLMLIERMERLVGNLLRLQKIRSDAYEMRFEQGSLRAAAEDVVNELRPVFPDKVFALSGDAALRFDSLWLGEAMENVIKNAALHTRADGRISVTIEDLEGSAELTVEDDGGGVPEEELGRLFSRFYGAADADSGSTGLGLAITRAIVEKHHGTVTAENGARGLRVHFCFPRADGRLSL